MLPIFFVYEFIQSERDEDMEGDPNERILYFYPPKETIEQKVLLTGSIIGVIGFTIDMAANSTPSVIKLHKRKYAILLLGKFCVVLGRGTDVSDRELMEQLQNAYKLVILYHGSLDNIYESCDEDKAAFMRRLQKVWDIYLPHVLNYMDPLSSAFSIIPTIELPKNNATLFLRALHVLESSQRRPDVLAGCVLFRKCVLCTQLDTDLTWRLMIMRPRLQKQLPGERAELGYDLKGCQLYTVYLTKKEYASLQELSSKDFRHSHFSEFDRHHSVPELSTEESDTEERSRPASEGNLTSDEDVFPVKRHTVIAAPDRNMSIRAAAKQQRMTVAGGQFGTVQELDEEALSDELPGIDSELTEIDEGKLNEVASDSFSTESRSENDSGVDLRKSGVPGLAKATPEKSATKTKMPTRKKSSSKSPKLSAARKKLEPGRKQWSSRETEFSDSTDSDTSVTASEQSDDVSDDTAADNEVDLHLRLSRSVSITAPSRPRSVQPLGEVWSSEVRPDLVPLLLYTQRQFGDKGYSDLVLLLLMKYTASTDPGNIDSLFRSGDSLMRDLDMDIKQSLATFTRSKLDGSYLYLVYDKHERSLRGYPLRPVHANETSFCETSQLMHEEFLKSEQLSSLVYRNGQNVVYGQTNQCQEVYYQHRGSHSQANTGVPCNHDLTTISPQIAQQKLAKQHGITII